MEDNMREIHAQMDAIGRRIITKEIGCNIEYALECFRERRRIVPCLLRESELIVDQIGFRLHDACFYARRVPGLDVERYVKDDAYYAEQQEFVQQLLDPEKADRHVEQALALLNNGDEHAGAKEFYQAAMCGSPSGQLMMVPYKACDEYERYFWLRKAASGGMKAAMVLLGDAYRDGKGVNVDLPQMLYYYCTAAMQPSLEKRAVRSLGQTLQEAKVLQGLEEQGAQLLEAADNLEDEEVACRIREIATLVRTQLLEKYEVITLP